MNDKLTVMYVINSEGKIQILGVCDNEGLAKMWASPQRKVGTHICFANWWSIAERKGGVEAWNDFIRRLQ